MVDNNTVTEQHIGSYSDAYIQYQSKVLKHAAVHMNGCILCNSRRQKICTPVQKCMYVSLFELSQSCDPEENKKKRKEILIFVFTASTWCQHFS